MNLIDEIKLYLLLKKEDVFIRQITGGYSMSYILTNWKTTTVGALAILMNVLVFFGVPIPTEVVALMNKVLLPTGLILAKDSNVTGGSVPNK